MTIADHSCRSSPTWIEGLRPGDLDGNDDLQLDCPGCRADRRHAAEIAAWEDMPLDPDDDLAVVAGYPAEVARLRDAQAVIARHPVYQVVARLCPQLRRPFLAAAVDGERLRIDEADDFFDEYVCQCPDLDGQAAGETFFEWHREAGRCARCQLRDSIRDQQFRQLHHDVEADRLRYLAEIGQPPEQRREQERDRLLQLLSDADGPKYRGGRR